jgi:Putative beta-barrel porin 2
MFVRASRLWRIVASALFVLLISLSTAVHAQDPSPAAAPVPVLASPPPSSQERLLVPVPPQFDWIQREVRPNPLLETLLTLQDRPARLFMSATLAEEYSDNFSQGGGDANGSDEYRTILNLGTVYRLDNGQSFVSLANSISANYQARAEDSDIGFANLSLNVGHQMPRLSLALSENFVRDDDTGLSSDSGVRRGRRTFLRNRISPQMRYAFSRLTSMAFAYTNTIVLSEGGVDADDAIGHAIATSLQHQFSRFFTGNTSYTFTTHNSDGGADSQSHRAAVDFGYLIDRRSSLIWQLFGLITDRSDGGTDSHSYGASFGIRRQLTSFLGAFVSVGATVLDREAEDPCVFMTWEAALDGVLPISRHTSLVLSSQQNIGDTADEVDNIGMVLRQAVTLSLNHLFTPTFLATVFVNFTRTEQLEDAVGTTESVRDRDDNFWRAGARAAYALSRVFSLSLVYLYQRRDSTLAGGDFDENRLTLALSSGWSIF